MDVFVARQPIFDAKRQVYGYELLFRAHGESEAFDGRDGTSASLQVLSNSLMSAGLENILSGKKGFINFDRNLLVGGFHALLPPETLIIEVLETVEPDAEVMQACREVSGRGYSLVLDDFVAHPRFDAMTRLAKMIKVDMRSTTRTEQRRLAETYRPRGIAMLAEKVETNEEFDWALNAGYELFQGYFFARPTLLRGRQVPSAKLACLRLLSEMQRLEIDFDKVRKLVSEDVALSFKLLRYANSALFAREAQIHTIHHALVILGEAGVRHWVALAALPVLAKDKPGELVTHSLVRARFCERVLQLAGKTRDQLGFLMGLFSMLDGLIDMPLEEALLQVKPAPELKGALLGTAPEDDLFRSVFNLVCRYESADWDAVGRLTSRLGIRGSEVAEAYAGSALWAAQSLHATSRMNDARRKVRHAASGILRILWEDPTGRERVSNAQLKNVSAHGLQLQVEERIPARTYISCNDVKSGISGRGCVRYCNAAKGRYLIGVEFSSGTGWREPKALH